MYWNPQGLSRPVMGLFYLNIYIYIYACVCVCVWVHTINMNHKINYPVFVQFPKFVVGQKYIKQSAIRKFNSVCTS
jgi:hypothetical protein